MTINEGLQLFKKILLSTILFVGTPVSSQTQIEVEFDSRKETLEVLTLEDPLVYTKKQQIATGFEFEVLQNFATAFDYRLKVTPTKSISQFKKLLSSKQFDLLLGRIPSDTDESLTSYKPSLPFESERASLVCKGNVQIQVSESGQIRVLQNTKIQFPNSEFLELYKDEFKKNSQLTLTEPTTDKNSRIFREFVKGKDDCLMSYQLDAQYFAKIYPKLKLIKNYSIEHPRYYFFHVSHPKLQSDFSKWIQQAHQKNIVLQIKKRISGQQLSLKEADFNNLENARNSILPEIKNLFLKYSQKFYLPWELMAAVAYQESHWNNEAISFTGVKGIMQITNETAEFLGIDDRMDMDQSIFGGFKYLRLLIERTPQFLPIHDRLALALATYNIGPGHMIDAQKLAIHLGKNPHSWHDLKNVLPLLASDEYLPFLKYGKARGYEPVHFVHSVLTYFEILKYNSDDF